MPVHLHTGHSPACLLRAALGFCPSAVSSHTCLQGSVCCLTGPACGSSSCVLSSVGLSPRAELAPRRCSLNICGCTDWQPRPALRPATCTPLWTHPGPRPMHDRALAVFNLVWRPWFCHSFRTSPLSPDSSGWHGLLPPGLFLGRAAAWHPLPLSSLGDWFLVSRFQLRCHFLCKASLTPSPPSG